MKIFLIIAIFSCIAATSFAQRVPSSCDAPDSIRNRYREDAAWLAYQYEQNTNSPYVDSVIIPQGLQDKFMNAMLAVYNAVGLPQADTVTRIPLPHDYVVPEVLHIHHPFKLGTLFMRLDTTVLWENTFLKKVKPTGNVAFDSLMSRYSITVDSIYDNYSYGWAVKTSIIYNAIVLDSLMSAIMNNYYFAQIEPFCCDGDAVGGVLQNDSSVQLSYSLGWVSCETGCAIRRFWTFTIFPDCSVKFEGAFTRTPENWKVNSTSDNQNKLNFYPNPSSGILTIETQPHSTIEIIALQGKVLQSTTSQEEKTDMDISSFSKGIYFVRITSKNGKTETGKFIKD